MYLVYHEHKKEGYNHSHVIDSVELIETDDELHTFIDYIYPYVAAHAYTPYDREQLNKFFNRYMVEIEENSFINSNHFAKYNVRVVKVKDSFAFYDFTLTEYQFYIWYLTLRDNPDLKYFCKSNLIALTEEQYQTKSFITKESQDIFAQTYHVQYEFRSKKYMEEMIKIMKKFEDKDMVFEDFRYITNRDEIVRIDDVALLRNEKIAICSDKNSKTLLIPFQDIVRIHTDPNN